MKRVVADMDDDLCKQLKLYAVETDKSVKDIIVDLVKKNLKQKRANTVTLAGNVFTPMRNR